MPKARNMGLDQPAGRKAQASRVRGVNKMQKQDAARKKKSTAVKSNKEGTRGRGGQRSTRGF